MPPSPSSKPNRLIHERSPYLLQHAHNPVDWHPWGEEALSLAKQTGKPIFLSIGYSTCHWCHVMAHESFEDPATAVLMNQHFINIKVDREERPDIDALYMQAVQALTGSGGWPMSVWLTPDLKPFYGGTYFPPDDRYGRPGFPRIVSELARVYEKDPANVAESSRSLVDYLSQAANRSASSQKALPNPAVVLDSLFNSLKNSFDPRDGGFSSAPKFPMPVYLDALVYLYHTNKNDEALPMASLTLKKMAEGGLYDQLGGGFARYSTDNQWRVPHFEKMLYDNALLIQSAVHLYQATGDPFFADLIRDSIGYVLRDLHHSEGGFFSAEDADSEGKEGAFYLWTLHEIRAALGDEADVFIERYGVTLNGNFMDPHTQEIGKNVLHQAKSIESIAETRQRSVEEIRLSLNRSRQTLFAQRAQRIRPHLDDKVITEWNAMMISALARAGAALLEPSYMEAAEVAALFIRTQLTDGETGRLYRRWREGERGIEAQQVDYAFLIQALLDLHEATGGEEHLTWAYELQKEHDRLFWDEAQSGYFMNVERADLLIRLKDEHDNVIPSGNSVAAHNLLRLAALFSNHEWAERARSIFRLFSTGLGERSYLLPLLAQAFDVDARDHQQVILAGPRHRADTQALARALHQTPSLGRVVLWVDPSSTSEWWRSAVPNIQNITLKNHQATAYVCRHFQCEEPVTTAAELQNYLLFNSLR